MSILLKQRDFVPVKLNDFTVVSVFIFYNLPLGTIKASRVVVLNENL